MDLREIKSLESVGDVVEVFGFEPSREHIELINKLKNYLLIGLQCWLLQYNENKKFILCTESPEDSRKLREQLYSILGEVKERHENIPRILGLRELEPILWEMITPLLSLKNDKYKIELVKNYIAIHTLIAEYNAKKNTLTINILPGYAGGVLEEAIKTKNLNPRVLQAFLGSNPEYTGREEPVSTGVTIEVNGKRVTIEVLKKYDDWRDAIRDLQRIVTASNIVEEFFNALDHLVGETTSLLDEEKLFDTKEERLQIKTKYKEVYLYDLYVEIRRASLSRAITGYFELTQSSINPRSNLNSMCDPLREDCKSIDVMASNIITLFLSEIIGSHQAVNYSEITYNTLFRKGTLLLARGPGIIDAAYLLARSLVFYNLSNKNIIKYDNITNTTKKLNTLQATFKGIILDAEAAIKYSHLVELLRNALCAVTREGPEKYVCLGRLLNRIWRNHEEFVALVKDGIVLRSGDGLELPVSTGGPALVRVSVGTSKPECLSVDLEGG